MNLIQQLIELRTSNGLSQAEVGKRIGHTKSWVSKLERKDDRQLRVGEIQDYLSVVGLKFQLSIPKRKVLKINPLEPTYCLKCLGKYSMKDMEQKPRKVIKLGACKNCGEML